MPPGRAGSARGLQVVDDALSRRDALLLLGIQRVRRRRRHVGRVRCARVLESERRDPLKLLKMASTHNTTQVPASATQVHEAKESGTCGHYRPVSSALCELGCWAKRVSQIGTELNGWACGAREAYCCGAYC